MLWEGDCNSVEKLITSAKKVIKKGFAMTSEPFEKRVQLWNNILENYDKYDNGECGKFLEDLDMYYISLFDIALLILARSFKKNSEDFPSSQRYSDEEIEVYERIEKYSFFEIRNKDDIKKIIAKKDQKVMDLLKEYFITMNEWVDETLEKPDIRLTIRFYLKRKWENYKEKIDGAVNELIAKLDWLAKLIGIWGKDESQAAAKVGPPEAPNGPDSGLPGISYKYSSKSINVPDDDTIEYKFDWGDGSESSWISSPFASHVWNTAATFKIKLKYHSGKDESGWSPPSSVTITPSKGSRLVKIGEAKWYENNFIGRMKNKLFGEISIGTKNFIVDEVSDYKGEDISKYVNDLSDKEIKNLPENKYIKARLHEKKILGRKEEIIVKIMFFGRVHKYVTDREDTFPLEFVDVNPHVTDAMDVSKNKKMLLCIASPTGFNKDVTRHIEGKEFHKNYLSNVSVCLMDLETGKLIMNPYDKTAKEFKEFCMLETDQERDAKLKQEIEDILNERNHVTLTYCIKMFGDKISVKKAFYDLEEEKGYSVKNYKDIGLVLMR